MEAEQAGEGKGIHSEAAVRKTARNWQQNSRLQFRASRILGWKRISRYRFQCCIRKQGETMNFYEKMRMVCMAIPAGTVATYGQIAMLCGEPKNSRQVGCGLKNGLAGRDVPAFRIVNSNLTAFAPDGCTSKISYSRGRNKTLCRGWYPLEDNLNFVAASGMPLSVSRISL